MRPEGPWQQLCCCPGAVSSIPLRDFFPLSHPHSASPTATNVSAEMLPQRRLTKEKRRVLAVLIVILAILRGSGINFQIVHDSDRMSVDHTHICSRSSLKIKDR